MTKTIVITSGKGGVGKTSLTANLSVQLASQGFSICVFDADLGLANINILFGIYTDKTIEDVVFHDVPLSDIIIKNYHGIDIIPGSSGVEKIADLEPEQTEKIIESFSCLAKYDYLIFDTSAGVARNVVSFCLSADVLTLVITSEPTSLTDGYALLKVLCLNGFSAPVRVIVNNCKNTTVAKNTYAKFRDVVRKYLPVDIHPLGFIVDDHRVKEAVERQKPYILLYPETAASKCIRAIAANLVKQREEDFQTKTPEKFLKRFISAFSGRLHFKPLGVVEKKPVEQDQAKTSSLDPEDNKDSSLHADIKSQKDRDEYNKDTAQQQESAGVGIEKKQTDIADEKQEKTPQYQDVAVNQDGRTDSIENKETAISLKKEDLSEKESDNKPGSKSLLQDENPYSYQNRQIILNKLIEGIMSVSSEIKLLHETIAANGSSVKKTDQKASATGKSNGEKPIVLNFDNYIPKKYSQTKVQKQ